ncbi:MAG: hypothetical protein IJY21_05415 [Clostridia bacterium]|nr:hypothetical protein [Clostridia bacterium]
MKRFFKFLTGALLCLTCVFAIAGCGGSGGSGGGNTAITEEEWSSSINDTGFVVETGGYTALRVDENSYETYKVSAGSAYLEKTYLNGVYEAVKEGGEWQPLQPIDQTAYQYNVQGIKGVIDFVKNNRDAFTYSDSKYTMDLESGSLETEIEIIKGVLSAPNFSPIRLEVEKRAFTTKNQEKNYIVITMVSEKGGPTNVVITLQSPILQYEFDVEKKNRLTNFVIKGGPSRDDIDYLEAYFTQDGFRIYSPNNPDPLRRDAYLRYDSAQDKYYTYRQDAQGVWSVEETTRSIYENTKNETFNLYLGNFLEQSEYLVCDYNSGRCYNREIITKTNAMGTWSYFNIEIVISNTFSLGNGATWNMQLTQGQAQSLVYNIALEVGSVVLTYPQVA